MPVYDWDWECYVTLCMQVTRRDTNNDLRTCSANSASLGPSPPSLQSVVI